MPRRIGELRRLCAEWNALIPLAHERGITHLTMPDRRLRISPRQHFHMDRVVARQRVALLRAQLQSFFTADRSEGLEELLNTTFGPELEMILPRGIRASDIAAAIRVEGTLCQEESYNHTTRTHWKITTDGSLGFTRGRELVAPILQGEAGLDSIRKVCRVTTRLGCRVNRNCGLHVHVGVSSRPVHFFKCLVEAMIKFEAAIDSFMAPSRRGRSCNWAQPVRIADRALFDRATTLDEIMEAVGQPRRAGARSNYRYRKLNLLAFLQCGTVEFRQHQGTVEAQKTEMWVRFCLRLVTKCAKFVSHREGIDAIAAHDATLAGLMSFVGATETERNYFNERVAHFAAAAQANRRVA